jgi:hypothetical protein
VPGAGAVSVGSQRVASNAGREVEDIFMTFKAKPQPDNNLPKKNELTQDS